MLYIRHAHSVQQDGEFPLLLALGAKKNVVACLEALLDAGADLLQTFKGSNLLEINQRSQKRVRPCAPG